MKKLTALILALCLMLLCGCTAANKADLEAAKASGAAGVWYCNAIGQVMALTLNDDLSAAMVVEGDAFDYKGTWKVSGDELTVHLTAYQGSWQNQMDLGEWRCPVAADTLAFAIDGKEVFTFHRELKPAVEIAAVRSDAAYEDFIGMWNVEIVSLNGIVLEVGGEILPPSEMGAEMSVSIGTDSAAVETPAAPDTVYIFPTAFENGTLTMTLDNMVMTAQLLEDGMMSISGVTPLHMTTFTEDAPLTLYLRAEAEDLG